MEELIPVIGSNLFLSTKDENWIKVSELYKDTHKIEPRIGTSPDLRKLGDNQSVCWGDGESFHFLLTKL